MSDPLRILIVDDEPLSRERISQLLAREPDVEVVGERGDGVGALGAIEALEPDLVFLDVRMPELDGLGVVEALEGGPGPQIVFVTAHDEYMERAFAVHALDYLRKPFTDARFSDALEHARRRVEERRGYEATRAGVLSVLSEIRERAGRRSDRLVIRDPGEPIYRVVPTREIDWVETYRKMVRVQAGEQALPWARTLTEAERILDPALFLRVSRSTIVNTTRVLTAEPLWKGEYVLRFRNGRSIGTGRAYRDAVRSFLDGPEPRPSLPPAR
jgi:two-component system LytT family response regulator